MTDTTTDTAGALPAAAIESPQALRALPESALRAASDALRARVVEQVSRTGGHLGSGLGVVEMTVALHYVFDTPAAKLIWDVSHQCYPHKVLTGRALDDGKLRQGGGIAGFTCREESEHDPFGAAHSSTAISAGLGFAAARDFAGERYDVVAIVGDGAMSGGMAFEGLNNLGATGHRMTVILNDNDMSIAPPSGALALHLRALRAQMPDRETRAARIAAEGLPDFTGADNLFRSFGLRYAGPFDGHDVEELVAVLRAAQASDVPVLLHVLTVKGKGYAFAEDARDCGHAFAKFDVETGKQSKPAPNAPSYTAVFAKALIAEAARDPKIVAATAAMPGGTGLDKFGEVYPERMFDVGIAEQHAVTFCAGMAAAGMRPFAAIYSTFLQRGYDQVVHDVAIQRLPVRFALDRAGMVGADGVTHQGAYDIAYLGCLPGFTLMAAADEAELMHLVATQARIDDGPSALRYPRGEGVGTPLPEIGEPVEIGRGRVIVEGTDLAILSYGSRLGDALEAATRLAESGLSVTVADARFAKPLDLQLLRRLFAEHALVATVEEGAPGGFAALVASALHEHGYGEAAGRLVPIHMPDRFFYHDKPAAQIAAAGLDAGGIAARLFEAARAAGLLRPHLLVERA